MVTAVTSFGRSGLYDWLMQRISAVVLLVYTVFIFIVVLLYPDISYQEWNGLFQMTAVKIFSLLALISLGMHSWIGLWCVVTDYLTERMIGKNANWLRFLVQAGCGMVMFTYFVWGIQILWGN
jgi:succinate dehydrogenase / fumarate reductase membrane anchor subunit